MTGTDDQVHTMYLVMTSLWHREDGTWRTIHQGVYERCTKPGPPPTPTIRVSGADSVAWTPTAPPSFSQAFPMATAASATTLCTRTSRGV